MRLIVLLAFFHVVTGFGVPGIYERVFYYYAYLLDAQLNPTTGAQSIASGCAKTLGIGKTATCSFNDFNRYIFDGQTSPASWDVTSDKYPDPSRIADAFSKKDYGLGASYKVDHIAPPSSKLGANDVDKLIGEVTQFVKLNIGKLQDGDAKNSIKTGVFQGVEGIARNRMEIKIQDLVDDFAKGVTWEDENGESRTTTLDVKTKTVPLYEGAPDDNTIEDFDGVETKNANPNVTPKEIKGAVLAWNKMGAPKHNPNINAARLGASVLAPKCL